MTPETTYLLLPFIFFEIALLVYVWQIRPYALANRLFALYMAAIISYHTGEFIEDTAVTNHLVQVSVFFQALGTLTAGLTLWLLLIEIFPGRRGWWKWVYNTLAAIAAITTAALIVDAVTHWGIIIDFGQISLSNRALGFVNKTAGWWGLFVFWLNTFGFSIIALPLGYYAFSNRLPDHLKLTARYLFFWAVVGNVIYALNDSWPIVWRTMVTTVIVGSGIAVSIVRYGFLSVLQIGISQALDSVAFGILIFNQLGALLNANEAARKWLQLSPDNLAHLTLADCLAQMAEAGGTAVSISAEELLKGQMFQSPIEVNGRYLILRLEPITNQNDIAGVLCSLQDVTTERRILEEMREMNQLLQSQILFSTTLNEITNEAIRTASTEGLYNMLTEKMAHLFAADHCFLTLWDEETQTLMPTSASGDLGFNYPDLEIIPGEPTITTSVLRLEKPVIIEDVYNTPYLSKRLAEISPSVSMLGVPLIALQQKMGAILIGHRKPHHFNEEEVQWAEQIAGQMALILARNKLLASEREQRLTTEALHQLSEHLNESLDIQTIYAHLLDDLSTLVPYDVANIMVVEGDSVRIVQERGREKFGSDDEYKAYMQMALPIAETATFKQMWQTKEPFMIPDVHTYPGWKTIPGTEYIHSWAGAPILVNGTPIAFFSVDKAERHFYKQKHLQRLTAVATQASLALQKASLLKQTQDHANRLAALNTLAAEMARATNVKTLCQTVSQKIREYLSYPYVSVYLVDEANHEAVLEGVAGVNESDLPSVSYRQPLDAGVLGQVVKNRRYELINDTEACPYFISEGQIKILSELALPLKGNGRVIGILNIDQLHKDAFTETDIMLLTTVADQMSTALMRTQLLEETQQQLRNVQKITDFSLALRQVNSSEEILSLVLKQLVAAINYESGVIFLSEDHQLVSRYSYPENYYPLGLAHPLDAGISGHVLHTGKLHFAADIRNDHWFQLMPYESKILDKIRSMVAIPLFTENHIVGILSISTTEKTILSESQKQMLVTMGDLAASALYRAQVLETLEERVQMRTAELASANEKLKELDQLKNRFIADMSHELRTPVTNLMLYLDLLKYGRSDQREQYISVLREKGRQLVRLTEDILSISRLDLNHNTLQMSPTDINDIVAIVIEGHRQQAIDKNLTLNIFLQNNLPKIMAEPSQLAHALTHLLNNALIYTRQGSITLTTSLSSKGQVILDITDTGMGIPQTDLDHIFDRFYRGEKVGSLNYPGTGLGLAIAKEIVTLHNGQIKVTSTEGKGSTFSLYFPPVLVDKIENTSNGQKVAE